MERPNATPTLGLCRIDVDECHDTRPEQPPHHPTLDFKGQVVLT